MGKNTIYETKYPSKPSNVRGSLSNGPKYIIKYHMCGINMPRRDALPQRVCQCPKKE
jgi:hypothetical protein